MRTIPHPSQRRRNDGRWVGVADTLLRTREWDQQKWARLCCQPLLARCPLRALRRVASVADEVKVAAGDILIHQGRAAAWFFLIDSGEAEVERDGTRLAVLGPGKHFGEVALLARGLQPATVRALTPMTLFVVGSQRLLPLVEDVRCLRQDLEAALARQPRLVELARDEHKRHFRAAPRPVGLLPPARSVLRVPAVTTRPLGSLALRTAARPSPSAVKELTTRARAALVAVAVAVLAVVAATATFYHPPLEVIAPGSAFDIAQDITISGVPVHTPRTRYLLIPVQTERPSLFGVVLAILHGNRKVVHVSDQPAGPELVRLQSNLAAQFARSQVAAASAAARAAGFQVGATGQLPFIVHFRHRDIVGPSAGLIYALAIEDLLTGADRGHGRVIAASGEIDSAGVVSAVGYLNEKAEAARDAGAQLLLLPRSEVDEVTGRGVPVAGVDSLQDALAALTSKFSD